MEETWGNGHYSCYECKYELSKDAFSCKRCLTYTPLMKPYYQNWTKKEMSNADRIRSMTDEELSWFLCGVFDNGSAKFICGYTIPHYDEDKIVDWLKSPTTD